MGPRSGPASQARPAGPNHVSLGTSSANGLANQPLSP